MKTDTCTTPPRKQTPVKSSPKSNPAKSAIKSGWNSNTFVEDPFKRPPLPPPAPTQAASAALQEAQSFFVPFFSPERKKQPSPKPPPAPIADVHASPAAFRAVYGADGKFQLIESEPEIAQPSWQELRSGGGLITFPLPEHIVDIIPKKPKPRPPVLRSRPPAQRVVAPLVRRAKTTAVVVEDNGIETAVPLVSVSLLDDAEAEREEQEDTTRSNGTQTTTATGPLSLDTNRHSRLSSVPSHANHSEMDVLNRMGTAEFEMWLRDQYGPPQYAAPVPCAPTPVARTTPSAVPSVPTISSNTVSSTSSGTLSGTASRPLRSADDFTSQALWNRLSDFAFDEDDESLAALLDRQQQQQQRRQQQLHSAPSRLPAALSPATPVPASTVASTRTTETATPPSSTAASVSDGALDASVVTVDRPHSPPLSVLTAPSAVTVVPSTEEQFRPDDMSYENLLRLDAQSTGFGVTPAQYRRLRHIVQINADGMECSVCLEVFAKGDHASRLKCGHCFHERCVLTWFKQKRICPYCRFQVVAEA
eukprot:TRINITY_DN11107_c0_g1_i1.p1 TRINITY_DN11107_c0_g1~~TRINITY_DN11107_c0_g1_i1.p1  ORF type:complete len:534 (-),score=97.87 TRINITY_DN11107_c0_g1_i1:163-1764(-)